jgi:hypothetical protein
VTFQWPGESGAAAKTQTIRPATGERYAVVRGDGGQFAVKKE